jgi:hypothetical protein
MQIRKKWLNQLKNFLTFLRILFGIFLLVNLNHCNLVGSVTVWVAGTMTALGGVFSRWAASTVTLAIASPYPGSGSITYQPKALSSAIQFATL